MEQQQPTHPQTKPDKPKMSVGKKALLIIGGLIVLFIILGIISSKSNTSTPAASDNTNNTSNTSSQPAPAPTPTPTPKTPQVLLDVSGNGTKTTQKFTAASDWDLNWSYDCTSFGSQGNFQVFVYNGDGSLSAAKIWPKKAGM